MRGDVLLGEPRAGRAVAMILVSAVGKSRLPPSRRTQGLLRSARARHASPRVRAPAVRGGGCLRGLAPLPLRTSRPIEHHVAPLHRHQLGATQSRHDQCDQHEAITGSQPRPVSLGSPGCHEELHELLMGEPVADLSGGRSTPAKRYPFQHAAASNAVMAE